ncbi:MAG: AmmeMemoRadiSam system protein B [Gammaproteobacteria bacterium]|nr:AmmeMemoRadiSam system protein B [Gammaproteobacteria bacterium]
MKTRSPAVAGTFYPGRGTELADCVEELVAGAVAGTNSSRPKVLIVPHAGYSYSGPIAASGYCLLHAQRQSISRVVLLGPAHRMYVAEMALPSARFFATPLGEVPIDEGAVTEALTLPGVVISDEAHAAEHSLEVHLPFLQMMLDSFELLPVVVGQCSAERVATLLDVFWGGDETLIVVSSDLSHYLPYAEARATDARTTGLIAQLSGNLTGEQACGAHAINGLMRVAQRRALHVEVLDVRNSGDTSGERSRVVGYGSYALAAPRAPGGIIRTGDHVQRR